MNNTGQKHQKKLRQDAEAIFRAGVARVDPRPMVKATLQEDASSSILFDDYGRLMILSFGKAGARMAQGAMDVLAEKKPSGLVIVKHGFAEECQGLPVHEGGHPVPDEAGMNATKKLMDIAKTTDSDTLALILISGGASALLCSPWDDGRHRLSLGDKQAVTGLLLASGAEIREINTVRRHLSSVKGGRLASMLSPARVVSLILSDVVGDDLAGIASGPTVPDSSTWADAMGVIQKYRLLEKLPASVVALLEEGIGRKVPDTLKPGDPVFERVSNFIIGSNRLAVEAAIAEARVRGYATINSGSSFTGEARELAESQLEQAVGIARGSRAHRLPLCIVGGGESTVKISGNGKGGRNQEQALAFAIGLSRLEGSLRQRICYLSAGTDGNDGPTDAAGGFADALLLQEAEKNRLDAVSFLSNNDSYNFLAAAGGHLLTGATGTNVCDIYITIIT